MSWWGPLEESNFCGSFMGIFMDWLKGKLKENKKICPMVKIMVSCIDFP